MSAMPVSVQQYLTQQITRMLIEPPEDKTLGFMPASLTAEARAGVEVGLHFGWLAAIEAVVELIGTDPQLAQISWTGGPNPPGGE